MDTGKISEPTNWITFLKETLLTTSGVFEIQDDAGALVKLEWYKTDITSSVLASFKKDISELASQILASSERQFLQAYPHAVESELFLRACAPFFEKGIEHVDWVEVESKIRSTIKQFYLMDLSKFGDEIIKPLLDDIYLFAQVKEVQSGQLSGFIMTSITPALLYGNVKIIGIGIDPNKKNRGLEKVLLRAIFTIIPATKRLFLFTRPTNESDLKIYRDLGFTEDLHPIEDPKHKVNMEFLTLMEYKIENLSILQKSLDDER